LGDSRSLLDGIEFQPLNEIALNIKSAMEDAEDIDFSVGLD
jgi:hypothetical protein